jgi:hypothetical protein
MPVSVYRTMFALLSIILPSSLVSLSRNGTHVGSHCGRRASTFLSCALRQQGHLHGCRSCPSSCAFREQGNLPAALCTILFLWQLNRPCPLSFGQRHFLKPAVRPLKLADLIDLYDKGIRLMRRAPEPIPAGSSGFILAPSIIGHPSVSFSRLS